MATGLRHGTHLMRPALRRHALLMALCLGMAPAASLVAAATPQVTRQPTAPSIEQVLFYTRPLVKARLRLPDSLQDFTVLGIAPTADDPARFAVQLRFKAKSPFGAVTEHRAGFHMKATRSGRAWVVTASPDE